MKRTLVALMTGLFSLWGASTLAEQTMSEVSAGQTSAVLSAGFGMPVVSNKYTQEFSSGTIGRSINAGIMGQISGTSFYWGLDFALNFWSFNPGPIQPGTNLTRDSLGIQSLLTGVYRFDSLARSDFYPYFGFSAGPQLYIQRNTTTSVATLQANTTSDTTLYLEFLARPGVEYHMLDYLGVSFEPKFGLLGMDFIFQPQIALTLLL